MELKYITTNIHSKESAGTVDGPGFRFVVFFQGCPLRCKFCHNPDTWDINGGKLISVTNLYEEIIQYKPFMQFSGGGVTVSGGEPLLHKKFIIYLFELLKGSNIHTAIDTSGFVPINEELDKLMDLTDLVLLDIKHLNPNKHVDIAGVNNHKILKFLDYLAEKNIKTWLRWVILPGFNDSQEYAREFADFVKKYPNVELVELLPYHEMGKYKWQELGLKYELENILPPSKEDVAKIANILNECGIKTQ